MEVKNFIKVYDNVVPPTLISAIIRWSNKSNFNTASVATNDPEHRQVIIESIRKTKDLALSQCSNSLTNVHYFNVLARVFNNYLNKYRKDLNLYDFVLEKIENINILKYEEGGFYKWHTDHSGTIFPRTISMILLLNNDYEGGELMFSDADNKNQIALETKVGRLVVWPSNFMFPHSVSEVTKGTRYSIVAWAV